MAECFERQLREETEALGITLSQGQTEQFYRYYELLLEWNKVMNLTAITEEQDVVTKHFTDSLTLVKALELGSLSVIDVGTGAGFPGIPLKIAFPRLQVTLLDSLNKRVKFLNMVCEELGLVGIQAMHGRAEDYGRDSGCREKYDVCVSRAVANMASLAEYCMPFVKVGGWFVPYKSGAIEEELAAGKRAVKLLGGEIAGVERFMLPGAEAMRSLVKIRKIRGTSGKYPRKAGIPAKEPLN